jgi:ribosomal protein L37E
MMPNCEKCWEDAGGDANRYRSLLADRNERGQMCSLEQQAGGEKAIVCRNCGRQTVHVHAGVCLTCGKTQTAPTELDA